MQHHHYIGKNKNSRQTMQVKTAIPIAKVLGVVKALMKIKITQMMYITVHSQLTMR